MPAAVVIWMRRQRRRRVALGVDLTGVDLLQQPPSFMPGDGDEDEHHVLQGRRQRLAQDVLQQLAAVAQAAGRSAATFMVAVAG